MQKIPNMNEAIDYYLNNPKLKQVHVAEKFNIRPGTFSAALKKDDRYTPEFRVKSNHYNKFSDEQRTEAIRYVESGLSHMATARLIGCTDVSVGQWVRKYKEGKLNLTDVPEKLDPVLPDLEKVRHEMYEALKSEYLILSSIIEENEQKRQFVRNKMKFVGEEWNDISL